MAMDHVRYSRLGRRLLRVLPVLGLLWAASHASMGQEAKTVPDVSRDHAEQMARGLAIFKKHVRPVLIQKCLRCHGGKEMEGALNLAERETLLKGGEKGPAVLPGKSRQSLLYKVIAHEQEPHMPHKARKLPAETIAHIAEWIDLGAPYDGSLIAGKKQKPSWTAKIVPAEEKQFWSFKPLQNPRPPLVHDDAWCKTPIDRFILARLEQARIRPNAQAGKRQLIRRAYFDLVGLPPPPEEIKRFLEDKSENAWEKLVDRLLNSPHYGERWGRHWLDLARFAESHGFEHDYDRPSAYHYRDFVIEALNRDLPYNTFVQWQIAGDELAPDNPLALKATGFLAAGVHSTQITKREVAKHRYDEMDDMLHTIGTSMLGLTIGCARCHDHKYDPIPQRDYYRLLATFTTTVRSEIEMEIDRDGFLKARAEFDREHEPFVTARKKFELEQLPRRLAQWEASANVHSIPWDILDPVEVRSKEGAVFKKLDDGSLLATGKNGRFDTYTFVAHTNLTGITAIRLEALADPSMIKGGPGRAANGNFALSDFQLAIAPGNDAKAKPVRVKLQHARATFEQKGLPVAAAIDTNEKSGWAVDPQFGKNHAAVFETAQPVGHEGGTVLTLTLHFKVNDGHQIGRPRLAITNSRSQAGLDAPGMPAAIRTILAIPAKQRTAEQKNALLRWYRHLDPEWQKLHQAEAKHMARAPKPKLVKVLISTEGLPAVRLHTQGADFLPQTHFLRRGDPDMKEGVAQQGFLQVLMPATNAEKSWQIPPPSGWRTSYQRRALAAWITDVDRGAGMLLARVIVNRLWQHHMGRGLVATPSDFGHRGEPPTHPALLDWLAGELIRNGWKLKHIHKLIMTSAVYKQNGHFDEDRARVDRDNTLCWRVPPRRLEAETIRDSLLAVSGMLDPGLFGPGTLDENSKRRSIYFTVKRSKLIPMMTIFDAPEALTGIAARPTTTVAPQALYLMNNPQVRNCALGFARRLAPAANLDRAVNAAYEMALGRPPRPQELADSVDFIRRQQQTYRGADREQQALADFCQVLVCLNEFVYVE
jgi:mono/diheme cytochrome c family protein